LQSVAADVQIDIGTSFGVVGVSFAVADVVSGGMTSRLKMSVLRSALMPVFAPASPETSSAAAFTVVVLTPSAPDVAPALLLLPPGELRPTPVTRIRFDCCSMIFVTKRGLAESRDTLRNASCAPLPPRF
jgi:hypothetical protein